MTIRTATAAEVDALIANARRYRSPMADIARWLLECLFLLSLRQDFVINSRNDGEMTIDDMYVYV